MLNNAFAQSCYAIRIGQRVRPTHMAGVLEVSGAEARPRAGLGARHLKNPGHVGRADPLANADSIAALGKGVVKHIKPGLRIAAWHIPCSAAQELVIASTPRFAATLCQADDVAL